MCVFYYFPRSHFILSKLICLLCTKPVCDFVWILRMPSSAPGLFLEAMWNPSPTRGRCPSAVRPAVLSQLRVLTTGLHTLLRAGGGRSGLQAVAWAPTDPPTWVCLSLRFSPSGRTASVSSTSSAGGEDGGWEGRGCPGRSVTEPQTAAPGSVSLSLLPLDFIFTFRRCVAVRHQQPFKPHVLSLFSVLGWSDHLVCWV